MTLQPVGPDIVEFAVSPKYLGKSYLSVPQLSVLKAIYGLEMSREERLAFLELSEGREPRKSGYDEAAIICGVRAGKSDMGAIVATYECLRWGPLVGEMLMPGQRAHYILIARNQQQAGVVRGYIEGNLQTIEEKTGVSVLAETEGQEKAITGRAVKLKWPIEIMVFPANKAAVRGFTGLGFVGDEIAHWECGEGAYNQDTKIMRAVRGRFATLSRLKPKKILISSPNLEEGVLFEEWKRRDMSKALVVRCPTWVFNPTIEQDFFDAEQEKDPEWFATEYGAEFAKAGGGNAFLPADSIDQCVVRGVTQIPHKAGVEHIGWIDAAFKRDRFSFAIAHAERMADSVKAVFDHQRHWTPPRGVGAKPLDDDAIVEEIVADLRLYGMDTIHGDQHADIPLKNNFARRGITFVLVPASKPEKFDAFKNLRSALKARLVELLDDPIAIRDLKGLVRKETPDGYTVQAPKRKGSYDDAATVVSRLVMKILPLNTAIDLEAWNARAKNSDNRPRLDWRDPDRSQEYDPNRGMSIWEAVL